MEVQVIQSSIRFQECVGNFMKPPESSSNRFRFQMSSCEKEQCLIMLSRVDELEGKLHKLERMYSKLCMAQSGNKKKNRRNNEQIEKTFRCLNKQCKKFYASATSLKFHMKIKHSIRVKKRRLENQFSQMKS